MQTLWSSFQDGWRETNPTDSRNVPSEGVASRFLTFSSGIPDVSAVLSSTLSTDDNFIFNFSLFGHPAEKLRFIGDFLNVAGQINIHEPPKRVAGSSLDSTVISQGIGFARFQLVALTQPHRPRGRREKIFFPHESPRCFSLSFSTRWPSPGYSGAYLNNCLSESGVAAPTDPMHTNELPSDSSTGRDQHAAAENATFMSSEKHEKTQRTVK